MPSDMQKQAAKSLHKLAESCGAASRPDVDDNIAPPEPKSGSEVRACRGHWVEGSCTLRLQEGEGRQAAAACACGRAPPRACCQPAGRRMRLNLRHHPTAVPPLQVMLGAGYVNSPKLSDLTFIVEGRPFHAHRIALLSASEIFKTMFDGSYREKDASTIPIPNIRWEVFERMMTCIYTGARWARWSLGVGGRGARGGQRASWLDRARRASSSSTPGASPNPPPPRSTHPPAPSSPPPPLATRRRQGGRASRAGAGAAGGG